MSGSEWHRVVAVGTAKNADSEAKIAVILHPSDRACPWNTATRVIRQYTNPSEGGFFIGISQ